VCFDGGGYASEDGHNVPLVLDNLIHAKELPVTICLFLTPGQTDAYGEQRSLEYDTVSDVNADFLLQTILPHVEARYTITDDPAKRCVCGLSSGGIAAFSVAWFRPESFGCVISWIGCKLTA
jgi:enterochelin esterase-like enzyme